MKLLKTPKQMLLFYNTPMIMMPDSYSISIVELEGWSWDDLDLKSGIEVTSGSWSDENISVNVDGLTVGTYAYVCTVHLAEFSSSKAVLVLVYSNQRSDVKLYPWLILTMVSVGTLVFVGAALFMRRKFRKFFHR